MVATDETYHEQFGDITSAKHFMNRGELLRFMRGEIGRERAFLGASSPEKLAGGTRSDGVQRRTRRRCGTHTHQMSSSC